MNSLLKELKELGVELGQSYFRAGEDQDNTPLIANIKTLSADIAEGNKKLASLKKLVERNRVLDGDEGDIKSRINQIKSELDEIYERVGLEIYGACSVEELNPDLKSIYKLIKEEELKSEELERELYKYENRVEKGSLLNSILSPFKLSSIKGKLTSNSKKTLSLIKKLGKEFCSSDQKMELKESLNELNDEYIKIKQLLNREEKSLEELGKERISNNKEVSEIGSRSKIETLVRNNSSELNENFALLGRDIYNKADNLTLSTEITGILSKYSLLKLKIDRGEKENSLRNKLSSIESLSRDIEKKKQALDKLKAELKVVKKDKEELESWLNDNPLPSQEETAKQ